jgi:hypothetical protein
MGHQYAPIGYIEDPSEAVEELISKTLTHSIHHRVQAEV